MTGHELKTRRYKLGMSQAQLAAALSTTANTIARWEKLDAIPALKAGRINIALKGLEPHRRERAQTLREATGGEWRVYFRTADTHLPLTNDERLALSGGMVYERTDKNGSWYRVVRSKDPIYSDMPEALLAKQ